MFDFVAHKRWYFLLSAFLPIPGLIFILLGGLKPSVDFTGGTVWEVKYADQPTPAEVRQALAELGHDEATVVGLSDGYLRIQTEPVDLLPAKVAPSASVVPLPSGSLAPTPIPSPTPSAAVTAVPSPGASGSPAPGAAPAPGTPFADLEAALEQRFGEPEGGAPRSERTVGPLIGAELIQSSVLLI